MLIFEARARLCACCLQSGSSSVFLLFEREGSNLEHLSLSERNLDLRDSLSLSRNDLLFPP